jgi:hypothetical protein
VFQECQRDIISNEAVEMANPGHAGLSSQVTDFGLYPQTIKYEMK